MPERVSKDKNRVVITEYEVRELDDSGEVEDVNHFETEAEARKFAMELLSGDCPAAVLEKHVSRRPARLYAEPDTYTTIATFGNERVIRFWNGEEDVPTLAEFSHENDGLEED